MKKLQVPLIVLLLLAVVFGMNTVADMRQKKAQALAKEAEQTKQVAAATAAAKNPPPDKHAGPAAFTIPPHSGPKTAPVKVEVFINNSNSCHAGSVDPMKDLQKVYGGLVRMEWYSTNDPKVSARADALKLGCEAGLSVNGKAEAQVERDGGKVLVSFRGPSGDKYRIEDLYRVVNSELKAKGKTPPAGAVARTKVASKVGPKH